MKIGLFGGSFNPIHLGHLILAQEMLVAGPLDRIVFIPSGRPPHKEPGALADPVHRIRMAQLATAGDTRFEVSDIEISRSPGPCYTVETLERLFHGKPATIQYSWIVGADIVSEFPTWRDAERILELANVLVGTRGAQDPRVVLATLGLSPKARDALANGIRVTPRIDISASEVRRRVAGGLPITYWVPRRVEEYILDTKLYRNTTPAADRCGPVTG